MNQPLLIGYEFEFLVHQNQKPLSRKNYLRFHEILSERGWKAKYDPGTKDLVGSEKDGFYVTTDDALCIMELNTPPHSTIQVCELQIKNLLAELQEIYESLDSEIIFTSAFPGKFEKTKVSCTIFCKHEDCCNKSYIKYINVQRFGDHHIPLFYIAANHIWLDVNSSNVLKALRCFNRLSGVFCSLFGNGPIANSKPVGVIEGRDPLWREMLGHSIAKYDRKLFGMFIDEPISLIEYFDFIMDAPFYFGLREGKGFSLRDPSITLRDFFSSKEVEAQWYNLEPFVTKPLLSDFFELQHITFPSARLKYFFKDGVQLNEVLAAYQARDERALVDCFSKICIEVRTVGAQPNNELSAGPAFALGLLMNLDAVDHLLQEKPYSFWKQYYNESVLNGLLHPQLIQSFLKISENGLQQRLQKEEIFLTPLYSRLEKGKNPGQELLEAYKAGGLDLVFETAGYKK